MTPKALAATFGLVTADTLPAANPKPKPAADHAGVRLAWPAERRLAFNVLDPAAISIVATDGPVSVTLWEQGRAVQRLGHNRGIWPVKAVRSTSWRDTASITWDRSPFFHFGTQFRLWFDSIAERDQMANEVAMMMREIADRCGGMADLMHGAADLGPELDLAAFEAAIHKRASDLSITVRSDEGLIAHLDAIMARARAASAKMGRPLTEAVVAKALQAVG